MSVKLAIMGKKVSLFDRMSVDYSTSYDPKLDAVTVTQHGLGPKDFGITSEEIDDFLELIESYDPDQDPAVGVGTVEAVRKTIETVEIEGVKSVRFRPSLAKATRAVMVPAVDWPDFVRWYQRAAEVLPDAHQQYRDIASTPDPEPAE